MNALPDIVKNKLRANQIDADGTHPDFGILTAFIEGSLPRNHRGEVFVHLANCARCNELVSLATPPALENDQQKVRSTWSVWNLIPMPRFAVPAIGTALVLLAVWGTRIPTVQGPVARVAPPPDNIAALPTVRPTNIGAVQTPVIVARSTSQSVSKPSSQAPEIPSDVPEALNRDAANVTMHTEAAPPLPANPLPARNTYATPSMSGVAAPAAGPCWRVSDSDILQKANTCGDGWEDISLGMPVKVRVVLSQANSVWVGGNAGALYHSEDNGEHWNQVSIPTLSDDIVAIVFATPNHGRLATANGTTWATNDGGQTWRRQ